MFQRRVITIAVLVLLAVSLVALAGCARSKSTGPVPTAVPKTPAAGKVTPAATGLPASVETKVAPTGAAATPVPASTQPAPGATPTVKPVVVATAAPPLPTAVPGGPTTHTVQPGEWLWKIARQYSVSPQAIAAANPGVNFNQYLQPGQKLTIPAPGATPPPSAPPATGQTVHVVKAGENLFRIALKYNKSVRDIAVANGISNVNLIHPGQRLVIP